MALKNRDNSLNYLRIKGGKFYVGSDLQTPYQELEGRIVELKYKNEEYEGIPQRKLVVILQDGDEKYHLGINVETSSYSSLVSFLHGVDLKKAITLHPKEDIVAKDGKEVKRQALLVSQDGKFAKHYFTKDDKHGLPEWNVVKVGNKKVTDKSDCLAFLEEFVLSTLALRLVPATETEDKVAVESRKSAKQEGVLEDHTEVLATTSNEKLPWED